MSEPFFSTDTVEFADPLRPARGIANGLAVSAVLWAVIALVWRSF